MSVFGLFITSLAGALFCALIYIYSRVRANHAPDQRRALKAGAVCLALAAGFAYSLGYWHALDLAFAAGLACFAAATLLRGDVGMARVWIGLGSLALAAWVILHQELTWNQVYAGVGLAAVCGLATEVMLRGLRYEHPKNGGQNNGHAVPVLN
jgi:heme/copper-type cytochrome/quinol oxidase subunit 3